MIKVNITKKDLKKIREHCRKIDGECPICEIFPFCQFCEEQVIDNRGAEFWTDTQISQIQESLKNIDLIKGDL